jgi:hypothetical protein
MHEDHDYDVKALPLPEMVEPPQKPVKMTETSNKKITEFFTVRRSVRKTKKEVQAERMRTIEQAIQEEREEGLEVAIIELYVFIIIKYNLFIRFVSLRTKDEE